MKRWPSKKESSAIKKAFKIQTNEEAQLRLLTSLKRWVKKNGMLGMVRGQKYVPSEELLDWIATKQAKLKEDK